MKNISIIGAGNMASEYLKTIKGIDGCKVTGIYSRTLKNAEILANKFEIEHIASSIHQLYELSKSELVIIAVNERSTLKVARDVFRFDWASLFEKPLGMNPGETELIKNYAKNAKNSNIFVALNRRYYESTLGVQAELDALDDLRVININDQEDTIAAKSAGRSSEEINNWHFLNAIHIIDYALIFGRGAVSDVTQETLTITKDIFVKTARIKFHSGDIALYQAYWNRPAPWYVSVSTNTKRFHFQPLENSYISTKENRLPTKVVELDKDQYYKPGLYNMINLFLDYQNDRSKLVSIEKYIQLISLISKIYPA